MRTDSIKNFISGNPAYFLSLQNKPSDVEIITPRKAKPQFDIKQEITNRTFIRPLPPKGHIVKSGILNAPLNYFEDVKSDINAIKSALKGDANDYQLGKLNDFGMKLGGLAIAGYLFTRRQTPITKAMEFIGLGSFFASMTLWPKIALDIPARIIHGFSPFMMYEDSQGRKKRFFTDNQYVPFDMLSHQDINRIGNRLGVPKNQVNYREAVQEKMRQIALQNNTMWMLTAGFATPIMSSLICNYAEPHIENLYNAYLSRKNSKIIEHFSDYTKQFRTNNITNEITNIITANDNKPITNELISEISKVLSGTMGPKIALGIKKDLNLILNDNKFIVTDKCLEDIYTRVKSILSNEGKEIVESTVIDKITPTEEQLEKILTKKEYFEKPLSELDIYGIIRDISAQLYKNIEQYNGTNDNQLSEYEQIRLSELLQKRSNEANSHTLEGILKERPAKLFDGEAQNIILKLAKIYTNINAEHIALSSLTYEKLAFAPNTEKAHFWNSTVKSIIKTLNITKEEIAQTHYDRKLVGELINNKIWQFATSSPDNYSKFLKHLAHDISQIDSIIKPLDKNSRIFHQMQTSYMAAANSLRLLGFNNAADCFMRTDGKEVGTLIGASKSFIKSNLMNLSSTFSAILNKANIYRTIYLDPGLSFINAENLPKEVKEEIVGLIEYLTTEGRIADYSVKFDYLRNLTPDKTIGKLDIVQGKGIKYSYYNAEKRAADGVFIKDDIEFFRRVMTAMFKTPLNNETVSALSEYSFVSDLLTLYRKNMLDLVVNLENFMYPEHVMKVYRLGDQIDKSKTYSPATPKERSNCVGAALDDVFTNMIRQKYNTQKWVKLFGGIGIGLLSFTIFSQFLFGRSRSINNVNKEKV